MSKKLPGSKAATSGSRSTSGLIRGRPSSTVSSERALFLSDELKKREEEYLRLNATLEEKTTSLVQEAESLLRKRDLFSEQSPRPMADLLNKEETQPEEMAIQTTRPVSAQLPLSSRKAAQPPRKSKSSRAPRSKAQPPATVSIVNEKALLRSAMDFDSTEAAGNFADAPVPASATEMGSEAAIRFMKAKLQVMQEELERLSSDCVRKDDAVAQLEGQIKAEQEKAARLQKQLHGMQAQEDKHKQTTEQLKSKNDLLESQLSSLRKELEALQRNHKQAKAAQSATEVRLNRALEEAERSRQALLKSRSQVKDTTEQDRRRIEDLQLENKQLQKQKSELIAAFKKQIKLIDVLKRQKMHMEAAQLLAFSEEEFVKALDWDS